jgi:hypothetical protein
MLSEIDNRKIFLRVSAVLLFIMIWGTVYYGFFTEILRFPQALKILDEILLLILFIFIFIKNKFTIEKAYLKAVGYLIIFFMLSFFSALWNSTEFLRYAYAIRIAVIPLMISYIIYNEHFSVNTLKELIRFCFYLIILHSVIVFFHSVFLLLVNKYSSDASYGIIGHGATNFLGFLISFMAIYLIYNLLFETRKIFIIYICILLFLITDMVFLEAKGAILSLVFAVIVMVIIEFKKIELKNFLIFLIIFILIILTIFFLINALWPTINISFMLSPFKQILAETQIDRSGSAARGANVVYVLHKIQDNTASFLFGYGPGTYESPAGYLFGGPHIDARNIFFTKPGGGVISTTQTQIANLLYEYGISGLLFFEIFLFFIFIRLMKFERRLSRFKNNWANHNGWVKYLIIIMFLGQFTQSIFDFQYVTYPFWIILFSTLKIYEDNYQQLCEFRSIRTPIPETGLNPKS